MTCVDFFRFLSKKRVYLRVGVLLMACASFASSDTVQDVLQEADRTVEPEKKAVVLRKLSRASIKSDQDVRDIYKEMIDVESEFRVHRRKVAMKESLRQLHSAMLTAVHPQSHTAVAQLLDQEEKALPRPYYGVYQAKTEAEFNIETPRHRRIDALIRASTRGRNPEALKTVYRLAQRNDAAGEIAVDAITEMANPSDIDMFVSRLKSETGFRVGFQAYGAEGVRRISQELKSGALTMPQKRLFLAHLTDTEDHASVPIYSQLLKDQDPEVRRAAARGLGQNARGQDASTIAAMMNSPERDVRKAALKAIDQNLWSPPFETLVIRMLEQDSDEGLRALAAYSLGNHRSAAGEKVLQSARKDTSPRVKGVASQLLSDWGK